MLPVRLACVKYLNTAPLIAGLEKLSGWELVPVVPSRIAGMIGRGEADLGLASVIDAAGGELALLPVGMIGCDGPTLTVRLFSTVPLEQVQTIHADTDSHTSVVLCRVLVKRLFGVRAEVVAWDASKGGALPPTVLLIGDKVVTDAPPESRYRHQLDLGEAWKKLTGLPFVYAMWMCRAERMGEERLVRAAAVLDRQRRHNRTRLDWIVRKAAAEHGWPEELAETYLGSLLRYEVGERERRAVEQFFAMAAEDGLIPSATARWAESEPIGAA